MTSHTIDHFWNTRSDRSYVQWMQIFQRSDIQTSFGVGNVWYAIQVRQKQERAQRIRVMEAEAEAKRDAELAGYDPWGKGGGGAPIRDRQGNIVTVLVWPSVQDRSFKGVNLHPVHKILACSLLEAPGLWKTVSHCSVRLQPSCMGQWALPILNYQIHDANDAERWCLHLWVIVFPSPNPKRQNSRIWCMGAGPTERGVERWWQPWCATSHGMRCPVLMHAMVKPLIHH